MSGVAPSKDQGCEIHADNCATTCYRIAPSSKELLHMMPQKATLLELGSPQAAMAVVDLNTSALKGIFLP